MDSSRAESTSELTVCGYFHPLPAQLVDRHSGKCCIYNSLHLSVVTENTFLSLLSVVDGCSLAALVAMTLVNHQPHPLLHIAAPQPDIHLQLQQRQAQNLQTVEVMVFGLVPELEESLLLFY